MSMSQSNDTNAIIIDFKEIQELENWVIVNDTVMGGRSRSQLDINEGYLLFSGVLSLENNGGFASTRRVHNGKAWLSNQPIKIQVKGDGREYQFRLRTNRRADGFSYTVSFKTVADQVSVFEFNQMDFVAQFRGRIITDAPALDFADIEQLGLILTGGDPGIFKLLVERISQSL